MAVNINTFVHTGGLLPGGFSGVALLIQSVLAKYAGISAPYGLLYLLLNLGPVILGFLKIGRKFTIYSCVTIATVSLLSDMIPSMVITYDVLLISIFGGLVNGFAILLCLQAQATSGGTDFISIFLSERFHVDGWNYVLGLNIVVLAIDGILFGWSKALYSIIFQFASTQVINLGYKRYKKNTLFIVTDHPEQVIGVINKNTTHGATEIRVTGAYEDAKRTMVYSVISGDELRAVRRGLHEADPKAFINVMRTDEIQGRFLIRPND